jgi:hypothetical protein
LLTILFSAWHSGQVNLMTYPDLVPAISGFTEEFFIEMFELVVLCTNGPDPRGDPVLHTRRAER